MKKLLFTCCLFTAIVLAGCTSNDDDEDLSGHYALMCINPSDPYLENNDLQACVDSILATYNTSNGYFSANATDANTFWTRAYSTLQSTEWLKKNIDISADTRCELALVIPDKNSYEVVSKRPLPFPQLYYRIIESERSSNYGNNGRVRKVIEAILEGANGDTGYFAAKHAEALIRLDSVYQAIMGHNWKNNDMAVLPNTTFTLTLQHGLSDVWIQTDTKAVRIPNY